MAVGSYAHNLHEGGRSEYLALFALSAFGTCALVPRQEDHGIDFHCTLSERKGRRSWPIGYYSVQVKSDAEPWKFPTRESVRWAVEYPGPLFLCIVGKSNARMRIYQTLIRFASAIAPELPRKMALAPGEETKLALVPSGDGEYSLGAPILDFDINAFLKKENFDRFQEVLKFWVLADARNIRRYQMGMLSLNMPGKYATNEVPRGMGATYWLAYAPPEIRAKAEETAAELLNWLSDIRFNDRDFVGTLLALLSLRNHDPGAGRFSSARFMQLRKETTLDAAMETELDNFLFAPYEKLLDELRVKVMPLEAKGDRASAEELGP